MKARSWALLTSVLILPIVSVGCSLSYVLKQGYYQAKLICGSEPITEVLQGSEVTDSQRDKLKEILDIRTFAIEKLAITPGDNYSTVNMSWDIYIHNVSASEALAFKPYTWWFPIVGTVPYKGFFVKKDAIREYEHLKNKGFDTIMRRVGGYSSLGYFSDPVWPQMLTRSERSLVELIIHETAHATVYFKGRSNFNESFANFVGKTGAVLFLADRYGMKSEQVSHAKNFYSDENLYQIFMTQAYERLDKVYKSDISGEQKLKQKKLILEKLPSEYRKIPFETSGYTKYVPKDLNNASLMSFKRYNSEQAVFAKVFNKLERNWFRFMDEMRELEKAKDPIISLRKLADNTGNTK